MSSSEIGVLLYLTPRNYLFKRADMLHMVPGPGQFEVVRRAGESKQHHGKLLAHIMASTPTVTWMTALKLPRVYPKPHRVCLAKPCNMPQIFSSNIRRNPLYTAAALLLLPSRITHSSVLYSSDSIPSRPECNGRIGVGRQCHCCY